MARTARPSDRTEVAASGLIDDLVACVVRGRGPVRSRRLALLRPRPRRPIRLSAATGCLKFNGPAAEFHSAKTYTVIPVNLNIGGLFGQQNRACIGASSK